MIIARRLLVIVAILVVLVHVASAQMAGKGLVINEIYVGTSAPVGNAASDQFIEIYNPQATVQYLDGCMIVRFGPTGGKQSGSVLQLPVDAWKFPGRKGGKTLPIQPRAFAVIAASAKTWSGGADLSSATFETYTGGNGDQDNPNSINLHRPGSGGSRVADLQLSLTMDAIVLTDGTDSVLTDGINLTSVIDGVQYNVAWTAGNLPVSVDKGFTGGPNLKYGVAMERNKVGVTTLNSSTDFALFNPSPGSEHGTTPPPPPPVVIKVTDLMPLDKGRYVDYNEYTTDSLGAIQPATVAHSSYTVFQTGLNFGGSSGVALVRDTANGGPIKGGTVADFHYFATSAGDIQVYADTTFFQQNLPAGFGSGLTAPNKFVDYLKMSTGENTSYPSATLSANITYSGIPVTINITSTGKYLGVTPLTVPQGHYDSAYRFTLTYNVTALAAGIIPVGSSSATQQIWLVKGIGIVRTNVPTVNFNITDPTTQQKTAIPVAGAERDMTAHGVRSVSSGVSAGMAITSGIQFYPDPAPDAINVALPKPARQILLYSATGQLIRSFEVAGGKLETVLWVGDIASGAYLARIRFEDGSAGSQRIVVQH